MKEIEEPFEKSQIGKLDLLEIQNSILKPQGCSCFFFLGVVWLGVVRGVMWDEVGHKAVISMRRKEEGKIEK